MNQKRCVGKGEDLQQVINTGLEVGLDEVGRGCIFGPVFAAAVVLTKKNSLLLKKLGVKDSKKLSKKQRQSLLPQIIKLSSDWGIGQSSVREIENLNIRKATEIAMIRAIDKLDFRPTKIYVDGSLPLRLWGGEQENIIQGESKFVSIAASSIVAKVTRDALIESLSERYAGYNLSRNKGYGTKEHFSNIKKIGPTNLHRNSFLNNLNLIY